MSKLISFKWERIADEPPTFRASVIGGWVLRVFDKDRYNTETISESMVFIPDAHHYWEV